MRKWLLSLSLLLSLSSTAWAVYPAPVGIRNDSANLYTNLLSTPSYVVTSLNINADSWGICYRSSDSSLYFVNYNNLYTDPHRLRKINTTTNTITDIGGVGHQCYGIACDNSTDTIYLLTAPVSGHQDIYTVNPSTAALTLYLNYGNPRAQGLAVDPSTHDLWVFQIDSTNSTYTLFNLNTTLDVPISAAYQGCFFKSDGTCYLWDWFQDIHGNWSSDLYTIDLSTAAITSLAKYWSGKYVGMTFYN